VKFMMRRLYMASGDELSHTRNAISVLFARQRRDYLVRKSTEQRESKAQTSALPGISL